MKKAEDQRPLVSLPMMAAVTVLFAGLLYWLAARACEPGDRLSPDHAPMHYYMGEYLRLTGQAERAVASFQRAVACNPESFAAHAGLGNALSQLNRLDKAEASYAKALEIEPGHAESLTNLGNLLLARGRITEACELYRRVLEREPDEVSVLNNLAWVLATSTDDALRDGGEAVSLAERASKAGGQPHPTLLMTLAAAYAEAGRFEEAAQTAAAGMQAALRAGDASSANELSTHLQIYRGGKAIRIAR